MVKNFWTVPDCMGSYYLQINRNSATTKIQCTKTCKLRTNILMRWTWCSALCPHSTHRTRITIIICQTSHLQLNINWTCPETAYKRGTSMWGPILKMILMPSMRGQIILNASYIGWEPARSKNLQASLIRSSTSRAFSRHIKVLVLSSASPFESQIHLMSRRHRGGQNRTLVLNSNNIKIIMGTKRARLKALRPHFLSSLRWGCQIITETWGT